jgi:hypothetical protein
MSKQAKNHEDEFTAEELATEEWRIFDVAKYYPKRAALAGRIKVSNLGRIQVYKRATKFSPYLWKLRYPKLTHNGKKDTSNLDIGSYTFIWARVVLLTWGGFDKDKKFAWAIDGNPLNARVSNLTWVTRSETLSKTWDANPQGYKDYLSKRRGPNNDQRVFQVDGLGAIVKVHENILEASRSTGLRKTGIGRCCRLSLNENRSTGKIERSYKCGGYYWFFESDFSKEELKYRMEYNPYSQGCKAVSLTNVDTGKVLKTASVLEASKILGMSAANCIRIIRKGLRTSDGHTLEYSTGSKKLTVSNVISNFRNETWPYATAGKEETTDAIMEMLEVEGQYDASFFSLPEQGRELKKFKDRGLIHIPDSVGIEKDPHKFNIIKIAYRYLFPGLRMEKGDVNKYLLKTDEKFDLAHLDYCGPLVESKLQAIDKMVNAGTTTFVTLLDNDYHRVRRGGYGLEYEVPIEELSNLYNVVFGTTYAGKRGVPMVTLGLTK